MQIGNTQGDGKKVFLTRPSLKFAGTIASRADKEEQPLAPTAQRFLTAWNHMSKVYRRAFMQGLKAIPLFKWNTRHYIII